MYFLFPFFFLLLRFLLLLLMYFFIVIIVIENPECINAFAYSGDVNVFTPLLSLGFLFSLVFSNGIEFSMKSSLFLRVLVY